MQDNGMLSMLWVGFTSIQRGWVNGLVCVVRDLQIMLRMLGEVWSQWYVAQMDSIDNCLKWILDI